MNGLIVVDKPVEWTSFDVVAKIRSILKHAGVAKPKVGHTGTLDPLATGVLVLTLGTYCKRAGEFSKLDKVYEVEITLGQKSTTDDAEGEITKVSDQKPSQDDLEAVIRSFEGKIEQIPPIFSAIKVNGKRAYKMAREGKEVALEPRKVHIYKIDSITYKYPRVSFTAHVSSGTYIRSLARDIGDKLETGAYMSALRRTKVGNFSLEQAVALDSLTAEKIHQLILE